LFESLPAEQPDRRWWAVYTQTRQEKALARQLLAYRIPYYLPLIPRNQLSRGRAVKSYIPLFPGYVFVYGCDDERVRAMTTNRVVTVLPVADQRQFYHDLAQIGRLIDSNAPLSVESRLSPGQKVRVKRGVLSGLEGVVTHRRGGSRLLVAVEMLRQGVSISIEDFVLEPV
jgi:transcription antitermination factor NusG